MKYKFIGFFFHLSSIDLLSRGFHGEVHVVFFLPNFIFLFYCFCMICAFYHFTECVVWHCFSYTNYLIDMVIL